MSYIKLGKEIVNEVSKTWGNLVYLNTNLLNDEDFKEVGKVLYQNKDILNDYLYYKYEWSDAQDTSDKAKLWIAEWWQDKRGIGYQKETFEKLITLILKKINWVYDEESNLYLPKGYHYSEKLKTLVFECNPDVIVGM